MSIRNCANALVLTILLATCDARAQQAASSAINLNVVVSARTGPPVADLQQTDFTILDNKIPQHIASFQVLGPRDPVHVTLVVDAVNVPYTSIAYQRGQIEKFLHANGGELGEPTHLAFFTDAGVQVQEGFTTDGNELNTSLSQHDIGLRDIHRSSQFERIDRLDLSLNALRELIAHEAQLPGRKMILWLSPGWPLLSGPGIQLDWKQQNHIFATVSELSTRMREAQIVLYNVNPLGAGEGVAQSVYYENFLKPVTKPGQAMLGDLALPVLAVQSGGLALMGSNDTAGLLAQSVAGARASYQISYTPLPSEKPEPYHRIEVQLSKSGLTARTRQGYYSQP